MAITEKDLVKVNEAKTSSSGTIHFVEANIFDLKVDALVNPVNCVGVMGKGLALEFKNRFPNNFTAYAERCKEGLLKPGTVFTYHEKNLIQNVIIFNFPTKNHWKDPSQMEYITSGLVSLIKEINIHQPKTIAIPALGCGLGGLPWTHVQSVLMESLLRGVEYGPEYFVVPPK